MACTPARPRSSSGTIHPSEPVRVGLWQLPSVPLHNTDCVHRQGIVIARGFLKTVPPKFPLQPHSFISSQRLGQPMLVMVLQVSVKHTDVSPGRCGFGKKDFEWVSSQKYESRHDKISEVCRPGVTVRHASTRYCSTMATHAHSVIGCHCIPLGPQHGRLSV